MLGAAQGNEEENSLFFVWGRRSCLNQGKKRHGALGGREKLIEGKSIFQPCWADGKERRNVRWWWWGRQNGTREVALCHHDLVRER